jgi:GAF domain-containing protein
LCETPIALISLIDPTRQWFKSCIGMPVRETFRDLAFCTHAILEPNELMEVEDAAFDERYKDNPLVTSEPNIRFYAGKAIVTHDGFALGTLCVIDDKPRRLSAAQRDGLDQLTTAVIELFQERQPCDRVNDWLL